MKLEDFKSESNVCDSEDENVKIESNNDHHVSNANVKIENDDNENNTETGNIENVPVKLEDVKQESETSDTSNVKVETNVNGHDSSSTNMNGNIEDVSDENNADLKRMCNVCEKNLSSSNFSKSQWKKQARRCKECIDKPLSLSVQSKIRSERKPARTQNKSSTSQISTRTTRSRSSTSLSRDEFEKEFKALRLKERHVNRLKKEVESRAKNSNNAEMSMKLRKEMDEVERGFEKLKNQDASLLEQLRKDTKFKPPKHTTERKLKKEEKALERKRAFKARQREKKRQRAV